MAGNTFYTAEQIAAVALQMVYDDFLLAATVNRDYEDAFGGGRGKTVNVKVPTALVSHDRALDETTAALTIDELTESTVPVTLDTHAYNAVGLSEQDLSLDLNDFSRQVLDPQAKAVAERIENALVTEMQALESEAGLTAYDDTKPLLTFTEIRKFLRQKGVPATGLYAAVGTDVYAHLLDADAIKDASQSGSTAALREGQVGRVRGFTVIESNRLAPGEIVAYHRDSFTLAVRAPFVPQGATFGERITARGFGLRYLRDYDALHTQDRSIVSTFVGAQAMPTYHVDKAGEVTTLAAGGAIRFSTDGS